MKITEHEMLVTLATMAVEMDDLTGHDIIESLRAFGYAHVVLEKLPQKPLIKNAKEAFVAAIEECQEYAQTAQGVERLEAAQQIGVRIALRAKSNMAT
jgi:hypothetical protein